MQITSGYFYELPKVILLSCLIVNLLKLTFSQDFTKDKEINFFLPNCLTRSIG